MYKKKEVKFSSKNIGSHICLVSKRVSSLCYAVPGTVYLNDCYVRRTNVYSYKKKILLKHSLNIQHYVSLRSVKHTRALLIQK